MTDSNKEAMERVVEAIKLLAKATTQLGLAARQSTIAMQKLNGLLRKALEESKQ